MRALDKAGVTEFRFHDLRVIQQGPTWP